MREFISRYRRYIICIVCILCVLAGRAYRVNLANNISMQKPSERWSAQEKEIDNAYVAAYIPEKEGIDEVAVAGFKEKIRTSLTEESFEISDTSRLYIDAYSHEGKVDVSKEIGKAGVTVNVTAVGGDFFFFHPMKLISGNYISGTDLMHDEVILDENTAWNIYGSADIQGKSCVINNRYYYIAGVVEASDNSFAEKTYGARNHIFMHFDEYLKIDDTARITTYELVYPEQITGKAENTIKNLFGLSTDLEQVEGQLAEEPSVEVVDMTRRFGFAKLFSVACNYGYRSSKTNGIIYPFWENECRMAEDYAALSVIWEIIFIALAVIVMIPTVISLYKFCVRSGDRAAGRVREFFKNR